MNKIPEQLPLVGDTNSKYRNAIINMCNKLRFELNMESYWYKLVFEEMSIDQLETNASHLLMLKERLK